MRKPNYVQIKFDTGRVKYDNFYPYTRLENNIDEINSAIKKLIDSRQVSFDASSILVSLINDLNTVVQRNNYLHSL